MNDLHFGRCQHDSFGVHSAPTPPRPGPARLAVLVHEGRRVKIDRVLECVEYARQNGLVGATVTCLGPREQGEAVRWCAKIVPFSWRALLAENTGHAGGPPSIGLQEAQMLIA